jgi:hypothetical protein
MTKKSRATFHKIKLLLMRGIVYPAPSQNTPQQAAGMNGIYSLPAGLNILQEGAWIY